MKAEKKVMDFFPVTTTDAVYVNGTNTTIKQAMDNGGGRDVQPDEIFSIDDSINYDPFILNTKSNKNTKHIVINEVKGFDPNNIYL